MKKLAFLILCCAFSLSPCVPEANPEIAKAYDKGVESLVAHQYADAWAAFRKWALAGDPRCMGLVGFMQERGLGMKTDVRKAIEWYHRAAEKGDSFAQLRLGLIFANGEGLPKDMGAAEHWLKESEAGGRAEAQFYLKYLAKDYKTEKERTGTLQWAAQNGSAEAQFLLAKQLASGEGIEENIDAARHWLEEAAAQNNLLARHALAGLPAPTPPPEPQGKEALLAQGGKDQKKGRGKRMDAPRGAEGQAAKLSAAPAPASAPKDEAALRQAARLEFVGPPYPPPGGRADAPEREGRRGNEQGANKQLLARKRPQPGNPDRADAPRPQPEPQASKEPPPPDPVSDEPTALKEGAAPPANPDGSEGAQPAAASQEAEAAAPAPPQNPDDPASAAAKAPTPPEGQPPPKKKKKRRALEED